MVGTANSGVVFLYSVILVLGMNAMVQTVPMLSQTRHEGTWDENMVDCSPGGRCWEWLRKQEFLDRPEGPEYYEDPLRMHVHADPEPVVAQLPLVRLGSSNRITKKDLFTSRGWGAGGMPFSVLYMNPHTPRMTGTAGISEIEPARALPLESSPQPTPPKHPNYRVALRNGASGQPRKQYSIIPQLFVSYGWGPLGK